MSRKHPRCDCGHLVEDHVAVPGHPQGALECRRCECGDCRVVIDDAEISLRVFPRRETS